MDGDVLVCHLEDIFQEKCILQFYRVNLRLIFGRERLHLVEFLSSGLNHLLASFQNLSLFANFLDDFLPAEAYDFPNFSKKSYLRFFSAVPLKILSVFVSFEAIIPRGDLKISSLKEHVMNMDDNVPVHSRAQFVAIPADDSSLCPVHCEGADPFPVNFYVLSQRALWLRNTFDVHPGSRVAFEDPQEQVLLGVGFQRVGEALPF